MGYFILYLLTYLAGGLLWTRILYELTVTNDYSNIVPSRKSVIGALIFWPLSLSVFIFLILQHYFKND